MKELNFKFNQDGKHSSKKISASNIDLLVKKQRTRPDKSCSVAASNESSFLSANSQNLYKKGSRMDG